MAKVSRACSIKIFCSFLLSALSMVALTCQAQEQRWSQKQANAWYAQQPWPVGSNYVPSDAINQLEMWQAATFDPQRIDVELGWAQNIGMNTMRVFLHDLLWQEDPQGFQQRIDIFLTIAARHHIKPMFVLFDSCWDPYPKLGPQHPPVPGVHNSGWVQSPGAEALTDPSQYPRLKAYVQGVVGAFANDPRILAWDVWNEPNNTDASSYGGREPKDKVARVTELLPQVFSWAREEHPSQPLTSGIWEGNWSGPETLSPLMRTQVNDSDIITFHNYGWPEDFEARIQQLKQYHRPIICTEYMARGAGSLFDTTLPIAKRYRVGAINWGFVAGKTQTWLPWDSWQRPYVLETPPVWFHDVFRMDGTPYREREVELIKSLTSSAASTEAGVSSR